MHLLTKIRRTLMTITPVKFMIRKSKEVSLPGFQGTPIFDVVEFFFNQIQKTSLTERAAAISFNILMAIPPGLIFLFTLIPFLPVDGMMDEIYALIRDVIPGEKNNAVVISFLEDFTTNQRNDLLSIGFILALFFSSNAMIGIMQSFNKLDYKGFSRLKAVHSRGIAIQLTLILYLLIILSIIALISRDAVLEWFGIENKTLRWIMFNLRWVVIFLLFFFIVSFIYRFAPAVQKKWKLINPGSLLATFLMIICTMLFSYWVINFGNYNKLYGSLGAILIVMVLIYFNSLVLLIGFELNVSISSLRKPAAREKNNISGKENP